MMSRLAYDKAEESWRKTYPSPLSEQSTLPEYKNGYLTGFTDGYMSAIIDAIKEISEKCEKQDCE